MNPIYEVITAAEAVNLWDLSESTVRRALWENRIYGRKSVGTYLITMTEMRRCHGAMPEHNLCDFIARNLTQQDVKSWHEDCNTTQNVQDLMDATGIDCIQIWGGHNGPEPLTVNIC